MCCTFRCQNTKVSHEKIYLTVTDMSPELIRLTKSPSKTFYSSVEALIIKNLSDLQGH